MSWFVFSAFKALLTEGEVLRSRKVFEVLLRPRNFSAFTSTILSCTGKVSDQRQVKREENHRKLPLGFNRLPSKTKSFPFPSFGFRWIRRWERWKLLMFDVIELVISGSHQNFSRIDVFIYFYSSVVVVMKHLFWAFAIQFKWADCFSEWRTSLIRIFEMESFQRSMEALMHWWEDWHISVLDWQQHCR